MGTSKKFIIINKYSLEKWFEQPWGLAVVVRNLEKGQYSFCYLRTNLIEDVDLNFTSSH